MIDRNDDDHKPLHSECDSVAIGVPRSKKRRSFVTCKFVVIAFYGTPTEAKFLMSGSRMIVVVNDRAFWTHVTLVALQSDTCMMVGSDAYSAKA